MPDYIDGAAELDQVLRLLPEEIARKVLDKAVLEGARVVAREMKIRAPMGKVDDANDRPPGFLRRNVRARLARPREYGSIAVLVGHANFVTAAIAGVSAKAFYARFVEWGFTLTSHKGLPVRFIGPRPFLRPAWDSTRAAALKTVIGALAKGIEDAAVRLAGPYRSSGFSRRGRTFIG